MQVRYCSITHACVCNTTRVTVKLSNQSLVGIPLNEMSVSTLNVCQAFRSREDHYVTRDDRQFSFAFVLECDMSYWKKNIPLLEWNRLINLMQTTKEFIHRLKRP